MQNISRRSLVAALGAAVPVASVAAVPVVSSAAFAGASPRLLELKRHIDEAWARQEVAKGQMHEANVRFYEELEPEWEARLDETQDLARLMFMEPTVSAADFALKLTVWESIIRDSTDDDDDLTECAGWIDRVLPRLFNDARALLGCPGTVA
jgi:hypothetical protein